MKLKKRLLKQKLKKRLCKLLKVQSRMSSQLEPESDACGSSPAHAEMSQGEEEDDDNEDVDWTYMPQWRRAQRVMIKMNFLTRKSGYYLIDLSM